MNIQSIPQLERQVNSLADTAAAAAGEMSQMSQMSQMSAKETRKDRVTLSEQYLRAQQDSLAQKQRMQEEAERSREEIEAWGEEMKTLLRCMKIAANIMNGDKVPPKDMHYLLENDPKSYNLAVSLRRVRGDAKECESVLGDEEETSAETGSADGVEGKEAPVMEAAQQESAAAE